MKSARFVCLFAILLLAALVSVLLAQSAPGSHDTHVLSAEPAAHPLPAEQKPTVNFARAVAYRSGGYAPDFIFVATGDLNGDGKMDLVVTNECLFCNRDGFCDGQSGIVSVLLGNGDGTFQSASIYGSGGEAPDSVTLADVNGDGKLDIIVANENSNSVGVLLGNGDGTFRPVVTYSSGGWNATSVAVADVNGDGNLDLIVANECQTSDNCNNGNVGVLMGNGEGTFQPAITYMPGGQYPFSVAVADLNGDGYPDLAVAGLDGVGLLFGNGDGTFQTGATFSPGGTSIAIGELNGDGDPDLVVTGGGGLSVLLGNGYGTFQSAVTYPSGESDYVVIADINGDGKMDLVTADLCRQSGTCTTGGVSVLVGNGDGTFQSAIVYGSGGLYATSVAVADVNADNKPDILVANRCKPCAVGGSVGVLLNDLESVTKTKAATSLDPAKLNQSVTFTATITSNPAIPNGEVITFYNADTQIGASPDANGVATLTTSFSEPGKYVIKAIYPGDAFHKASSGTVKQTVIP